MLLLAFSTTVYAQQIDFIVSASVGGPNDTITRKIAEKLEKHSSIQTVVINKPGGAHTIAYSFIQNTNKPTLLVSTSEVTHHDVFSQLDEVYNMGNFSNILFVSEKSKIKTFKELIELSKTRDINFGHSGQGTFSNAAMEQLCTTVLKCLPVPYKSGADGMLAIMSGQIDTYALTSYGSQQFLENSRLVAVHTFKPKKENSWVKLFSKNVSKKDRETIINILKQDSTFSTGLGFEK